MKNMISKSRVEIYTETGLADAGVLWLHLTPKITQKKFNELGLHYPLDHNPRYGIIDPYWCGVNSVVESMRNVASIGATPHAITDCLCFESRKTTPNVGIL